MPPKASSGARDPRAPTLAGRDHNRLNRQRNRLAHRALFAPLLALLGLGGATAAPLAEPGEAGPGLALVPPATPSANSVANPRPSATLPRAGSPQQRVPSLPELIDHALPGPYTLNLGLRGEWPEANPDQFGLAAELRWWLEAGAWLGVTTSWVGGVNDVNPDDLLIAHRAQLAATLGGRLPITAEVGVALGAKAGLMMVWGWPRGLLPDLYGELGPVLGGEVIVDWRLDPTWSISPRVGLDTVRILQDWLVVLGAGLDLVWRFGR